MTHPLQKTDRRGENSTVRKTLGMRDILNDLTIRERGPTILEKAKAEAVAIESKEEEVVVLIQGQKGIEGVVMKGTEAPQGKAKTNHHPTHIVKLHQGITERKVEVGVVKGAGLGM